MAAVAGFVGYALEGHVACLAALLDQNVAIGRSPREEAPSIRVPVDEGGCEVCGEHDRKRGAKRKVPRKPHCSPHGSEIVSRENVQEEQDWRRQEQEKVGARREEALVSENEGRSLGAEGLAKSSHGADKGESEDVDGQEPVQVFAGAKARVEHQEQEQGRAKGSVHRPPEVDVVRFEASPKSFTKAEREARQAAGDDAKACHDLKSWPWARVAR